MTDIERERLRRIAYGPDATPGERAAAETSLQELDERAHLAALEARDEDVSKPPHQHQHQRVPADGDDGTAGLTGDENGDGDDAADSSDHADHADQEVEQSPWQRRIRIGWVIPIVIGCLLLGVAGALNVTGQLGVIGQLGDAPETPGRSGSPTTQASDDPNSLQPPVGDLAAADHWFTVDAEPKDVFPHPDLLKATTVDPGDVRLLMSKNENAVTVWVGRNRLGDLCLLVSVGAENHAAASCSTREDFARQGAGFGVDGFSVSWDGRDVTISHITS